MTMSFMQGETVILHRRSITGRDSDGNDVLGSTDEPVDGCAFTPAGSIETLQGKDVVTDLRPLKPNEASYIESHLQTVSGQLRQKMPRIDARIALWGTADPTALDPTLVAGVLADVIRRFLLNPEAAASKTTATGPWSNTISFASYGKSIGGTGELVVTDDDLAKLDGPPAPNLPRMIRLRPPPHTAGCR